MLVKKQVMITLSEEAHHKFKVRAAQEKTTMKNLIERFINGENEDNYHLKEETTTGFGE